MSNDELDRAEIESLIYRLSGPSEYKQKIIVALREAEQRVEQLQRDVRDAQISVALRAEEILAFYPEINARGLVNALKETLP